MAVEVTMPFAQVVQVPHRNRCQPLVTDIAEHFQRSRHEVPGGRPGQGAVQSVRLGQHNEVGIGEFARQTVPRRAIGLDEFLARSPAFDDPRELLARVARRPPQVAQDQSLVWFVQAFVTEPIEHFSDVCVSVAVLAARRELDRFRSHKKRPDLLQRRELRFVHVDHHASDDRSRYPSSDSFLLGNAC
jgi:hypothetical protein